MGIQSFISFFHSGWEKHKIKFWALGCGSGELGQGATLKITTKPLFIYHNSVSKRPKRGRNILFVPMDNVSLFPIDKYWGECQTTCSAGRSNHLTDEKPWVKGSYQFMDPRDTGRERGRSRWGKVLSQCGEVS